MLSVGSEQWIQPGQVDKNNLISLIRIKFKFNFSSISVFSN